jgi:hypothetical protein
MNSEAFKNQEKLLEEKRKTVKSGSNVVHVEYFGVILNNDDLEEFSLELKKNELELSSFDKSGVAYNNLEDYTNMIYVGLNSELAKNILYAAAGSVVWESIKLITKRIFSKTKNQEINSYSGGGQIRKKEITFGIHIHIDRNTGFKFRLDKKFTTETIDKPLNQAVEFVKTQSPNAVYTHPLFLYYDHKNEKWIPVDMMEDIRKKHLKPKGAKKNPKSKRKKKKK